MDNENIIERLIDTVDQIRLADHCLVCGKIIPPGPDFCSLECETAAKARGPITTHCICNELGKCCDACAYRGDV